MNFTRAEVGTTFIAPAILGAVLGFLLYRSVTPGESAVLAVVFVVVGVIVVSVAAYGLRRLLLPSDKKDMVE